MYVVPSEFAELMPSTLMAQEAQAFAQILQLCIYNNANS